MRKVFCYGFIILILILSLISVNDGLPAACAAPGKEKGKENKETNVVKRTQTHPAIAQMKERLSSLSFYLLSYRVSREKKSIENMKVAVSEYEALFDKTYKITSMEEKERLKKIKEIYGELCPLLEDVIDLEEMCVLNEKALIENTVRAKEMIKSQIVPNQYSISKENEYEIMASILYEINMNLSQMSSKALYYIEMGHPDMKILAIEAKMRLEQDLPEYLIYAKKLGVDKKGRKDMEILITTAKQCAMDLIEDHEFLKEKLLLVMDKVKVLDTFLDLIKISKNVE